MPITEEYIAELERRHGSSPELDELQRRYVPVVIDPIEELGRSKEAWKLSREYDIPIDDSQRLVAEPEPSAFGKILERIKESIRKRTGYFEPPIYGKQYREEKPIRSALKLGAYYGGSYLSGRTGTALDVLAAKTTGDKTYADAVAFDLEPTPEEVQRAVALKYLGLFNISGKAVRKGTSLISNRLLPSRALRTILDSGLTFTTVETAKEVSENIIQDKPIDWGKIHMSGGVGVLFGVGESLLVKGYESWTAGKIVDEWNARIPQTKEIPRKELKQVAQSVIDAHKVKNGLMDIDIWDASHADNLYKFSEKLKNLSKKPDIFLLPESTVKPEVATNIASKISKQKGIITPEGQSWLSQITEKINHGIPITDSERAFMMEIGKVAEIAQKPPEAPVKAEAKKGKKLTGYQSAINEMSIPEEIVTQSTKEKLNIKSAAFLLDDGTVLSGEPTHIQLATEVPNDKTVIDDGFVNDKGEYIYRKDALTQEKINPEGLEATLNKLQAKPAPQAQAETAIEKQPIEDISISTKPVVETETAKQYPQNRYKGASTEAKEVILKQFYNNVGDVVKDEKMRSYYEEIKESFTPEEKEEFKDITGILDKQIAHAIKQGKIKPVSKTEQVIEKKPKTIVDRHEAGFVDLTPLATAGEQIKTTGEKVGKLITRFGGVEPQVEKVLIEYEEQMRELPKVISKESIESYGHLTPEQETAIRNYREMPKKYPKPEGLDKEIAQYEKDIAESGEILKELGYTADWPNQYRSRLEKKLAKENAKDEPDILKIEMLEDAIEEAKDLQYLHHYYQETPKSQRILNYFRKRISSRPSGLLGRKIPTYEKAKELGLEPAPLAVEVAHMKASAQKALEADKLIKAINENPNLSLPEDKAPEDWAYLDENIFPASVQHQAWVNEEGKPVHRKLRRKYPVPIKEALEELTYARTRHAIVNAYDNLNFSMKMIGFYNPLVMTKNDLVQGWRASGLRYALYLPRATKIFLDKGGEYQALRKAGLFNNVVNWTPSTTTMTQDMLDKIRMTWGEKVAKQAKKYLNPLNIVKNITDLNNKTTWNLDEIMRIACYESLKEVPMTKGMNEFEKTTLANDFMVNYAKLPKATKEHLSRAFFVPTYRIGNFRVWFGRIMAHPWQYKGPLLRTVGYKMFVRFGMPSLVAAFLVWYYGREVENIHTELGYRIVVPNPTTGKDTVYSLSDPLLEGAKLTQRDVRYSLKANLAAVPSLMYRFMAGKQYEGSRDPYGEFFKLGTPIYRDVVNWTDEDKTVPQKIMTQLAIAYVYTRNEREMTEEDKKITAEALAKALSIWRDWKTEFPEKSTKSGSPMPEKKGY